MNTPVNKPVDLVVEEYKRTRNEVEASYDQWRKDPSDRNHNNLCFKMGEYSTVLRFTSQHAAATKDKVLAAELEVNRTHFSQRWNQIVENNENESLKKLREEMEKASKELNDNPNYTTAHTFAWAFAAYVNKQKASRKYWYSEEIKN